MTTIYRYAYDMALPPAPSFHFYIDEFSFEPKYFQRLPELFRLKLEFSGLGLSFSWGGQLNWPEKGKLLPFPRDISNTNSAHLLDLIHSLPARVSVEVEEHYSKALPSPVYKLSAKAEPKVRSKDRSFSFDKTGPSTIEPNRIDKFPFVFTLGARYTFKCVLVMETHHTLGKQQGNFEYLKSAITHYVSEYEKSFNAPDNYELDCVINPPELAPPPPLPPPPAAKSPSVPPVQAAFPKQRVRVVKESKSGRNQQFKDENGNVLTREEFVLAIRQGMYPGYHIRKIYGIDTPVSNPDHTNKNNLG